MKDKRRTENKSGTETENETDMIDAGEMGEKVIDEWIFLFCTSRVKTAWPFCKKLSFFCNYSVHC